MRYIDLHAHMVSRSTDDYVQMALTGCVAVTEPAFWAGWDRSSADGFEDYFRHLTDFEPKRAAVYGIRHFAWLCLNPKEGEDRELARQVLARIPRYLQSPTVLGIGEIGLNRVTRNEIATFRDHVELALEHDQLIHIHTPHLEDGFWTGLTLYPQTKVSPERAIDMFERYGTDRICVASACDWGPSLPDAVPHFALAMRRRGHAVDLIDRIIYGNPIAFLGQSPKFTLSAAPLGATAAALPRAESAAKSSSGVAAA